MHYFISILTPLMHQIHMASVIKRKYVFFCMASGAFFQYQAVSVNVPTAVVCGISPVKNYSSQTSLA